MLTGAGYTAQPNSRRYIDVAIGVLVGLRQCTAGEAFEEIANAVHETGIGLGQISRALVELASGSGESFAHRAEAVVIWGKLVATRKGGS